MVADWVFGGVAISAEFARPWPIAATSDTATRRKCTLDRRRWKSVACGLAAVAFLGICATARGAEIHNLPGTAECTHAPTQRCAIGLSLAAADAVRDPYRRANVLVRIAEAQAEAGATDESLESLSSALTATAAITGAAYIGEIGIAALADVEAFRDKALVLSDIAKVLAKLGKVERAKATLVQAATVAARIWFGRYRAHSFVSIAKAQLAIGALDAARGSFARADFSRNTQYLPLFHKTVRKQAEAGDVTGALLTAGSMPSTKERDRVLAGVTAVQAEAGNMASALVTAGNIRNSYFRMVAMHHIGSARARDGDIDGAWDAVEEIGAISRNARDGFAGSRDTAILQADTIVVIVDAHIAKGEYQRAVAAAKGTADDLAFARTHAAVASAQTAVGDLNAARVTAAATCRGRRYGSRCVKVLAGLAVALATAGRIADVEDILSWARSRAGRALLPSDRARAFTALHAARWQMGDHQGARADFSSALTAAKSVSDASKRSARFAEMGVGAASAGDAGSASRAFSAALTTASEVEEAAERVAAFARIGLAQTRATDAEGARTAFSRAIVAASGIEIAGDRAGILARLAYALASGHWSPEHSSF